MHKKMTTSAPTVAAASTSKTTTSSNASAVAAAASGISNGLPASASAAAAAATAATQQRAMQSDEDFNIRFVNLVRMHKCLYDKKVPEYRNRDNQEKAWSLISQETRESVIHCKERWRNLRACLSRYIKQQSGSDPQHKPYYLTEHMAFLLPFLKSSRFLMDHNSLITLFQAHQEQQNPTSLQLLAQPQLHFKGEALDMKTSLSDNEDEETIDAFDPAVTASIQKMQQRAGSPLSDTASANTMQNFIPDVQLAELRCDGNATEISFANAVQHNNINNHHPPQAIDELAHEPKRIKTEPLDGSASHHHAHHGMYSAENSDMEFFRSILPDIAALTPQQKRKFKIGILELIDDVIDRYPAEGRSSVSSAAPASRPIRRNSAREWRK